MVAGEKQSFPLRISILYCLECYFYKNDFGKSTIVQTLLPQTEHGKNIDLITYPLKNSKGQYYGRLWCSREESRILVV